MSLQPEFPSFASNRPETEETVGQAVDDLFRAGIIGYKNPSVSIATAYINPGGYTAVKDALQQVDRVRLLLGAEPDPAATRARTRTRRHAAETLKEATRNHEQWLLAERDHTGFTREADSDAREMTDWLTSKTQVGDALVPRVEVRRYTDGFLHGKCYLIDTATTTAALAGSSNWTHAGMRHNAELNLGTSGGAGQASRRVRDWFDEYWEASEPYDLATIYSEKWEPHSPYLIFLRMLWALYEAHFDEDERRDVASPLGLTEFQADGVARMERLLEALGGVLVADEVGLGKTYLAAEVIRKANEERRQRVLIISPAALRDSMWEPFLEKHGFARLTKVLSYEQIRDRLDPNNPNQQQAIREFNDYALIVVDEAHNLRNAAAARSTALDRLLVSGTHPKQLILLTATPVNNSLRDLETLVKYFVRDDAHFLPIGIPSISEYIKQAQAIDPENLTPEHLFDLMDQVAVRRTRRFVRDNYNQDRITGADGKPVVVEFPDAEPYRIDYPLSPLGEELIDRMLHALETDTDQLASTASAPIEGEGKLRLARYTPSGYLKEEDVEGFQVSNAGLLRSALLKRLESSPQALASTLRTLESTHLSFLDGLSQGYVLSGDALRDFAQSESDDLEEILKTLEAEEGSAQPISLYQVEALRADVEADLQLIRDLAALAERVGADAEPKAQRLLEELRTVAHEARKAAEQGRNEKDARKTLVFSTYSDTVIALHDFVTAEVAKADPNDPLSDFKDRIPPPVMGAYSSVHRRGESGGVDQKGRAHTLANFAPKTAGKLDDAGLPTADDLYDLLITTDVLAEGVNLQQSGRIINYDLPWNPMRIVQRHGRVDRIGSSHDTVRLGLFFPGDRLDAMLGLEERLETKLAQADAAVGVGEVLPGRKAGPEVNLYDPQATEQIRELLEQRGGGSALSGEEYRRRLRREFDRDEGLRKRLDELPYGSGSGFVKPSLESNVFVFCATIGDHPTPWFRLVEANPEWEVRRTREGQPIINGDTLRSLVVADPGLPTTERFLTPRAYDAAFDAWQVAQDDILRVWQASTDPTALSPDIPKAFRDAAELVANATWLPLEERKTLRGRLRTSPTPKVQRAVRAALREGSTDHQRVELVREELDAAGIQEAPSPQPLPPTVREEIRLVAFMAVTNDPSPAKA